MPSRLLNLAVGPVWCCLHINDGEKYQRPTTLQENCSSSRNDNTSHSLTYWIQMQNIETTLFTTLENTKITYIWKSPFTKNIYDNFINIVLTAMKMYKCFFFIFWCSNSIEHDDSNAKVMGLTPRECMNEQNVWMLCNSLWIKACATCTNVKINK